jgi:hypothetical protein
MAYDARRDRWLGQMGLRVLRFWVAEVDENIEGVIETIADALSWIPPTCLPPHGGGRTTPILCLDHSGIGQASERI